MKERRAVELDRSSIGGDCGASSGFATIWNDSERAICIERDSASTPGQIGEFAEIERNVPANGIDGHVPRCDNPAAQLEIPIGKGIEVVHRDVAVDLHRAFGIEEQISRSADRRTEI